jgi:hypothetical protein
MAAYVSSLVNTFAGAVCLTKENLVHARRSAGRGEDHCFLIDIISNERVLSYMRSITRGQFGTTVVCLGLLTLSIALL